MTETKQAVAVFLGKKEPIPLAFKLGDETLGKMGELSLDDLVYEVLKTTLTKNSHRSNEDFALETTAGRWRSVYDIWRHVLDFKPEIPMLDVMDSLYRNRDKYGGHFCPDIRRRVFMIRSSAGKSCSDAWLDEFGLYFHNWKKNGA